MSIVYDTIYFKRGLDANLPTSFAQGEPGWTTDTHRFFVGFGTGMKEIPTFDALGGVTPEQYGATANGSTDDTTAIQTAIDTGKNVRFDAKVYVVNGTLQLKHNGQSLIGTGKTLPSTALTTSHSTVLRRNTTTAVECMIIIGEDIVAGQTRDYNQIHGVTIQGITFKGSNDYIPATKNTKYGIFVNNAISYHITDCNFFGFWGGINIRGSGKASTEGTYENFNGRIFGNVIEFCEEFGIAAGCGTSQMLIQNNLIQCIGPVAVDTNRTVYGIRFVSNGIGNVIRDNMVQVIGYAVYGSGPTNKTAHGIGIWLNAQATMLLEGNYHESCETTVHLDRGYGAGNYNYPYSLSGHTDNQDQGGNSGINIISCFFSGLQPLAIYLSYVRGVTIQGCHFGYYPITASGELWNNPVWGTVGTGYATWPTTGQGVLIKGTAVTECNMYSNALYTGSEAQACAQLNSTMGGVVQIYPVIHSKEVSDATTGMVVDSGLIIPTNKRLRFENTVGGVAVDWVSGGSGAAAYSAQTIGGYIDDVGIFRHSYTGDPVIKTMWTGADKTWTVGFADGANKAAGESCTFGATLTFSAGATTPTVIVNGKRVAIESQVGTAAANTITPRYIGDEYLLTSGPTFYKAKGLTTADWVALN